MSNEKRFVVKNGLQTDNIKFISPDRNSSIFAEMLDTSILGFTGSAGELLTIIDTQEGVLFSVNGANSEPLIEVDSIGEVRLTEAEGRVLVGKSETTDFDTKLQVEGGIVTDDITITGSLSAETILEVPRLQQSEINDLTSVKAGTIVFNTSINEFSMFTGASWMNFITTEGPASAVTTLEWEQSIDTYSTADAGPTPIHTAMRRCVLKDDGSVNYYLDPSNSTLKADGSAADLSGADGNVMVEIPKFYFRNVRVDGVLEWEVANGPKEGFTLHPAFIKNGVEVPYRYMGAYDACFFDASDGTYKSGLNLDDATSLIDFGADQLASVSGVYPLVGVTRAECRALAKNIGSGWHQQDFWLSSAVQLLYLVEYGDFNSQATLGDGNTNGDYLTSSSDQNDSPHTIAGVSNTTYGNESTDGNQPSAGAKPGTAYMSYRGIENFFGNCWKWVDGLNILPDHQAWATNDSSNFVDDTSSGFQFLGVVHNANGFVTDIIDEPGTFLPSAVGGSSNTFLTDNYFQNTGNRVARLGGAANAGSSAGAFYWNLLNGSSARARSLGARVCY